MLVDLPGWRNGRRDGLKIHCPQGCESSSLSPGIMKPKILVIVGPTASGKSNLAVKLALRLRSGQAQKIGIKGGEIISADSRQVYKGLNLGTGKITKKEMRGVPHHLLDIIDPRKSFSVFDFVKKANHAITMIYHSKKLPIIVGGTGFYIDALVYDQKFPNVKANLKLRKKLQKMSASELYKILKKKDLARAKSVDRNNKVRLIRALEIVEKLGKVPKLTNNLQPTTYNALLIGLKSNNEILRKNIHKRLIQRIKKGMIKEVKKLHSGGLSWKRMEELGLEYRYITRFLQNKITKIEMSNQLESSIWQYSRRQITWFKRNKQILWFNPEEKNSSKKIEDVVKKLVLDKNKKDDIL